MKLNGEAWLKSLARLPADFGRQAIPPDPERRRQAAQVMAALDPPNSVDVFPWGLEAAHRLWAPWQEAREEVESAEPGEPGAQADYILHDPEARSVALGLVGTLDGGCPRFHRRACNKLIPMGHENTRETCDYWDWPGMAGAAPGLELFPEWQRFDCHRYHPLFQTHLCGLALGRRLGASVAWVWHGPPGREKALLAYAQLTSTPASFTFVPL